jgi:hypothetical protein
MDPEFRAAFVSYLERGSRLALENSQPGRSRRHPFSFPGPNERVTFTQHAPAILKRLEAGTMPCYGAWPKEKVDLFRRWLDSGMVEA